MDRESGGRAGTEVFFDLLARRTARREAERQVGVQEVRHASTILSDRVHVNSVSRNEVSQT